MHIILNVLFLLAFTIWESNATSPPKEISALTFPKRDSLQKENQWYTVVLIYTDWCFYCKLLKRTTLKNKKVKTLLNNNFYYIPFNAEQKQSVKFRGHTYTYSSQHKIHELAVALATINERILYPTFCILNEKDEIVFQYPGFLPAKNLVQILNQIRLRAPQIF